MRFRVTLALIITALAGSGCSALQDDSDGVQVAAAFYPLQWVSQQVAGEHASVHGLTRPGGEPHDLELTIKQTAQVAEADVVVYERGFQPTVDDAVDENATGKTVDAGDVAGLVTFAEHGTDEAGDDPHFWQDPMRLADVADAVADALAEADPDHADDYHHNAEGLRARLEQLDGEYRAGLADCDLHTIVASHDAFGYLDKYGIKVAAIAGLSPDAEPTPADLARLHRLIRTDGITTVFGETLAPPRLVDALADDAGVGTAVLDPIEGLTDQTADEDYLSLMQRNLSVLEKANRCR